MFIKSKRSSKLDVCTMCKLQISNSNETNGLNWVNKESNEEMLQLNWFTIFIKIFLYYVRMQSAAVSWTRFSLSFKSFFSFSYFITYGTGDSKKCWRLHNCYGTTKIFQTNSLIVYDSNLICSTKMELDHRPKPILY